MSHTIMFIGAIGTATGLLVIVQAILAYMEQPNV